MMVAAVSKLVTGKKAIRDFIYCDGRINLVFATRYEQSGKGRVCNSALQGE
jgi:hypothetical protein